MDLLVRGHPVEGFLGTAREGGGQAADLVVRLRSGADPGHVGVEQLGQSVLQQRQGAGLVADVGHDAGDQARFVGRPLTADGLYDRRFELVGGER